MVEAEIKTQIHRKKGLVRQMAINIDFISHLPMELQEDILRTLSKRIDKDSPLEIDDIVYFVEEPVATLIEKLTEDCIKYKKKIEEISGIQKN